MLSSSPFPHSLSTAWNSASKPQHALSGFRCTNIHPYNPDVILSQVYARNERFKGCVIDVNERTDNSEEGNNEDEMSNQENNEDEDNNQDNMIMMALILNIILKIKMDFTPLGFEWFK